jgi:hypothetical protein
VQRRLGLGGDRLIAFGVGEFDEAERIVEFALELQVAVDGAVEPVPFAQDALRLLRVIPEVRVLREGVQLLEPPVRLIPVKDASSAGPTRSEPRQPPLALQHACARPFRSSFR